MIGACSSSEPLGRGVVDLTDGNINFEIGLMDLGSSNSAPELELEENFRSPVVSGPFLWSANPETNRVARIDARSLDVSVVEGGHAPTFLAALPSVNEFGGVLSLNVLGGDASIFTVNEEGGLGGASGQTIAHSRISVQPGASAWTVGKGGKFAVAWSRFEEGLLGRLDGYQDLTVVDLQGEGISETRISVGYRPTQVSMNEQESRLFVVSTPGISVIRLDTPEPTLVRELFLPDGGDTDARDVSFTPDGRYAYVRLSRRSEILIIRTEDDVRVTLPMPGEVTDLDLSGDGSLAVAVIRGDLREWGAGQGDGGQGGELGLGKTESHIALLPVPGVFDAPTDIQFLSTSELIGSTVVSDDASVALFFTTAVDNPRLSILQIEALDFRSLDLQAPLQAAFVSARGDYAVAVLTPPSGSSRAGAFALVPVKTERPLRIQGTNTVPRFVALDDDRALVTTWGSQVDAAASFLGKFPDLSVDRIELSSEPLASGMIRAAGQAYVAQAHPEGRVTFVNLETSSPSTVTGFELANKVVEQ